jgi:methyl-accepting chemotaxis protein
VIGMQERRKVKVIKRDFQYNFMLKGVLVFVISLNMIIFSVYMLDRYYGLPGTMFSVFPISLFFMEVAAVAIVAWIGRDVSFHIAGPVFAMERSLKDMAKGELSQRLKLRDGDNFTDAADSLNMVLETYQERIAMLQALMSHGTLTTEVQLKMREELAWFQVGREDDGQPVTSVAASPAPVADWAQRQSA